MRLIWALLAVAVLGAAAWGGYWFIGARAMDRAVALALERNPAFTAESHKVRGFPNRFDLTLSAPQLAQGAVQWRAPFIQFFALSYRLNHVIAVFAHDQLFSVNGQEMTLHSADMRASLVMAPDLSLPLERFALVAQAPALRISDETHRADALRLASQAQAPWRHRLVIELENAFPDPAAMASIDPQGHWPRRFEAIALEGEVEFDRPLDRQALESLPPRLSGWALTRARLVFEGGAVEARGRLIPDARGLLSGEVVLELRGWRDLIRRARDAGLMPEEHEAFIMLALQGMSDAQDPERLEVPLSVRAGVVSLGPVVLGAIPPVF